MIYLKAAAWVGMGALLGHAYRTFSWQFLLGLVLLIIINAIPNP